MAIDVNILKLLLWAKNLGAGFGRTATMGRMGFCCSPGDFRRTLGEFGTPFTEEQFSRCFVREPFKDIFAEELYRLLGAEENVSVDRSSFEGANFLHDLNEPFPEKMRQRFDFVLDGGTLEHVFNYPAALKHTMELVRVGGHFLTIPPANGQMGHGFYQCSPELFWGVFNAQNGFKIRKIVLFESYQKDVQFYEVQSPAAVGGRVELGSSPPVALAILAQRTAEVPIFATPPQQSDYVAAWNAAPPATPDVSTPMRRLRVALNPYWPDWLRQLKRGLNLKRFHQPPPGLANTRIFRPISAEEMARERAQA